MDEYITEYDIMKKEKDTKRNVLCIRNGFDEIECTVKPEQYKIFKKLSIKALLLIILFCFVFAFQFKISFNYIEYSFFNYNKFVMILLICFAFQLLLFWIIKINKK